MLDKEKGMDKASQMELEAAVFRRLIEHLQGRTDVQNIDLMNLAGFCRNCLSKWYIAAAEDAGLDVSKADAQERVYGMSYEQWKSTYQTPASEEQQAQFAQRNLGDTP